MFGRCFALVVLAGVLQACDSHPPCTSLAGQSVDAAQSQLSWYGYRPGPLGHEPNPCDPANWVSAEVDLCADMNPMASEYVCDVFNLPTSDYSACALFRAVDSDKYCRARYWWD